MTGSREYRAWYNVKVRCFYKRANSYKNYGGRGIAMCERWKNSFEQFFADMGHCPDGYSIERINADGHYEAENCRWIPMAEQSRNKRDTLAVVDVNGTKHTLKDIAAARGISYFTLRVAVQRGENPFKFTPRPRRHHSLAPNRKRAPRRGP